MLYPDRVDIPTLSFPLLFCLSMIAPCVSILLGHDWVTVTWWSVAAAVVWLVHTVQRWIDGEAESISELEGLKYVAPGA